MCLALPLANVENADHNYHTFCYVWCIVCLVVSVSLVLMDWITQYLLSVYHKSRLCAIFYAQSFY